MSDHTVPTSRRMAWLKAVRLIVAHNLPEPTGMFPWISDDGRPWVRLEFDAVGSLVIYAPHLGRTEDNIMRYPGLSPWLTADDFDGLSWSLNVLRDKVREPTNAESAVAAEVAALLDADAGATS